MSVVSWGAPTLQFVPVTSGGSAPAAGAWTNSIAGFVSIPGDVLLEDSSQLNTTAGEKKEIHNEKGVVVDSKQMPASYQFTTSVIKKKGETRVQTAFAPVNGVVSGNYAMRLIAEDPATPGFEMRMVSISVSKGWSADQGALDILTIDGIEPNFSGDADKEICEDYTQAAIVLGSPSMSFTAAGSTKTSTVTTVHEGGVTLSVPAADAGWLSATVNNGTISVTAAANTGSGAAARTSSVAVIDSSGNRATISVSQSA